VGFTYVKVAVYNPADTVKGVGVELLVDTGAILTAIPREVLGDLEIKPVEKRRLRVFEGQMVERDTGVALIKYGETMAGAPVIFGEKEDTAVLGATALEALGYQVDPVTKQLKPVELLMI